MGIKFTGLQALGLGLNWDNTTSQKQIAQDVLDTLSDRRVLHGHLNDNRPGEDVAPCLASAQQCRAFLTEAITSAKPGGPLRAHLRVMRSAFTSFIQLGGRDGTTYHEDLSQFRLALGVLRSSVTQVADSMAELRGLTVPDELAL